MWQTKLRDLPIGVKVLLAPIVMLLIIGVPAGIGWQVIEKRHQALVERVEDAIDFDRAIAEVPVLVAQIQKDLFKMSVWSMIGVIGDEVERTRRAMSRKLGRLLEQIDWLERHESHLISVFRPKVERYHQEIRAAIALSARNPVLAATAARGTEQNYLELQRDLADIAETWKIDFDDEMAQVNLQDHRLSQTFLGLSVLAALLSMMVALALGRKITQPILELVKVIGDLRQGKLDVVVPEIDRRDEIGRVAQAIADFKNNLCRTGELEQQRERFVNELERLAYTDVLTGLGNRTSFQNDMRSAFDTPVDGESTSTLLLLDLDRFKEVNDVLGHEAGDALLRQVADRLREISRPHDRLYRLGGDEFAVILQCLTDTDIVSQVARRILDQLRRPFALGNEQAEIGASIGIAMPCPEGSTSSDMVRHADLALYDVKSNGRNGLRFFEERMNRTAQRRQFIERELKEALAGDLLQLYYQPQIRLADRALAGAEALLRWQHPIEGWIGPAEFVAVAERSGLINDIGYWVLRAACRQSRVWRDAGLEPPPLAVNVSANQLKSDGFFERSIACLRAFDLPSDAIRLELTETLFVDSDERSIIEQLERLRAHGFLLALDDFGTGYSSLGYLRKLPFDELKIDACFIREMRYAGDAEKLTAGIIALGHSLGMGIVAEGVETEDQVRALGVMGCDIAQGFYFSRPIPAADFERMLQRRQPQATAAYELRSPTERILLN